ADRDQVGMRQATGSRGLLLEARARLLVRGHAAVQHLDRDVAAHALIQRAIHAPHAALPDALLDRVAAGDGQAREILVLGDDAQKRPPQVMARPCLVAVTSMRMLGGSRAAASAAG